MPGPDSTGRRPPRLLKIQYLRGAAATGVLAYHAGLATGLRFDPGAFGVQLFFVISGFLMVAITDSGTRPLAFLRDRIARVVPLYWIATAAALALGALLSAPRPGAAGIAASFLFLPWGDGGGGGHYFPALKVGWTLNYEMLFYLLFAALLAFPRYALLPALALSFAFLSWLRVHGGGLPWDFWGNPIIYCFLAGALLGLLWQSSRPRPALAVATLASAAALAVLLLAPGRHTGMLVPASALVAAILWLELLLGPRPRLRLPLLLGEASYSIYLWHTLALALAQALIGRLLPPALGFALYMAVGLAAGVGLHLLLERPLVAWFRRPTWRHGAPVPGGV
ncbi:MAG: acyltransferase [Alphaproteobacteria bacterium]|nr:acyltransferase [Alphaproteobacteria bacterium]MBV9370870.1 acyltransferase [Alphaproteobacteria bacterium]MBV9899660.1 acyltransferase [Alphaproteobacteria bacterium]